MKHYAGKVKYTVEGWVERNMDRVPVSFNETLQSSTHKVGTMAKLVIVGGGRGGGGTHYSACRSPKTIPGMRGVGSVGLFPHVLSIVRDVFFHGRSHKDSQPIFLTRRLVGSVS